MNYLKIKRLSRMFLTLNVATLVQLNPLQSKITLLLYKDFFLNHEEKASQITFLKTVLNNFFFQVIVIDM